MSRRICVKYLIGALLAAAVLLNSTAQAGQGWYLMTPPLAPAVKIINGKPEKVYEPQGETWNVDTKAPINEWEQVAAYETADRCQAVKLRLMEQYEAELKGSDVKKRERARMHYPQFIYGKCIASDDPRLVQR